MVGSGETHLSNDIGGTPPDVDSDADFDADVDPALARTAVREIEVDRARAVTVVFGDGTTAVFDLLGLRRACPCAGCRGRREVGRLSYEGDSATVIDAELHGNWAISLRWHDGHDTGMYAWTYLRDLADGVADPLAPVDTEHETP